ncbi:MULTISPECIES: hypothetical protein [Streptomyces]|uniref:Uncharacterized protein n=1 Tax=Streptomyces malaysiensis TaxID=92644 RepID=A0A7X5X5T7_STRMQ|nr:MULTISPECIES: hypothetical protein [Streptomyces]MYU12702.1 hypothetical protein [Streptomyces sp. SID8361]NIY67216.1 hypothetical protein [Streptomyces malaysiensis]SCF94306.1 hypothetical protein GA0115260_104692 [Streptomyces sp. MnatMP-M27]
MNPTPAERVAAILRDEFAAHGVRLPDIRADLGDARHPRLELGTVPLGTGFALLRVLTDYQRLLKAERARFRPPTRGGCDEPPSGHA